MSGPMSDLVSRWSSAEQRKQQATDRVRQADEELTEARAALGLALDPGDMEIGENLSCWVRTAHKQERLVVVTKQSDGFYWVKWRGADRAPGE